VISPYTRRRAVDSTLYTTINLFRTIEQILGLPPTNQFDAAAHTMAKAFANTADTTPFDTVPNIIALDEMNNPLAR